IVSKEMYSFEDKPVDLPEPMVATNLDAYLQILEDGIRRGDIPSTEPNRSALELVRQTSAQHSAITGEIREHETKEEIVEKLLDAERLLLGILLTLSRLQLGEIISLRPEATASVVRAYIEHGMQTRPGNVKLYYVGPMFRRELPQKGRYRESSRSSISCRALRIIFVWPAASITRNSSGSSHCEASRTRKTGGSFAGSTTTCGLRLRLRRRGWVRRTRYAAAGAMTDWWGYSADRQRQRELDSRSAPIA